jgi:hypothetical protein
MMRIPTRTITTLLLGLAGSLAASAQDFDTCFADSTLRLDYVFGADANHRTVLLERQIKMPKWAGRRHHLAERPLTGNGDVVVRDAATGDTIYVNTFSSLFHEWLSTDEAKTRARAFQNTFLVPYPKADALIDVTLYDNRRNVIASSTHRFSPTDVLVELKGDKEPTPHRYIRRSSHPETAIDVAILAEGYTPEEMDSFYAHAANAVDALMTHEPFASRIDDFNFVAVAAPSAQSGVSVPLKNEWKQTAVGSHFSTFYSDRYLTTDNVHAIHNLLAGIPYEHIIILANTDEYGGGGIYNSYTLTTARHAYFRPVVVHEFGHSFGGLTDEYFYDGDVMEDTYPFDVEPWEKNITTLVNFESKWPALLKKGTPIPTPVEKKAKYPVGVYEGGGYSFKNIYRPADECRMRNNTYPAFCPVCQHALTELIDFYVKE